MPCIFICLCKESRRERMKGVVAFDQGLFYSPSHPQLTAFSLCFSFSRSCSGLHLSLNGQSWTDSCLDPVLQREKVGKRGGLCNNLMRCKVSMATLSQEGKKKRLLSPIFSTPLSSVPLSPVLSLSCPPPQLARGFVRRQMIPQMPQPSRPFQLHSPASPQVRGHRRASEWVSVATVAMAVERVAEAFCCRLVTMGSL